MTGGKLNCWEYIECGREPGGRRADRLGVCPTAVEQRADGINGGINGGRCCWAIAGSMCRSTSQGVYPKKLEICLECSFFKKVEREEGPGFTFLKDVLDRL